MYEKLITERKNKFLNPFMSFMFKAYMCQIISLIVFIVYTATKENNYFLPSILLLQINSICLFIFVLLLPFYFKIKRGQKIKETFKILYPSNRKKKYHDFLSKVKNMDLIIILIIFILIMVGSFAASISFFVLDLIQKPKIIAEIVIFSLITPYILGVDIFTIIQFLNITKKK